MPATLQAPGEQTPLGNTMGAMLIGIIFSACLYGISLVQTLYYFSRYPKDAWYLKSLVACTVVFDTVHMFFISHTIYHYVIVNYYNATNLNILVWSVLMEALFTGVTGALVQFFYAIRIWRLSKGNFIITGSIIVLILATAGCGTAWVIISMQMKTFQELLSINSLTITINALSAAADVIIATSLCILLHRQRTGFRRSDTMINKLILFVVNTGALTSFCAIGSLVSLIISPNTLVYASFYFCIGRLYSNSLLAALNARDIIRGIANGLDIPMESMPPSVLATQDAVTSPSRGLKNMIRIDTTTEYTRDHKLESASADEASSATDVPYGMKTRDRLDVDVNDQ